MKKVLAILLALAMVFSMAGVVSADTQLSQEGSTEVTYTTEQGYTLSIPSDVVFSSDNLESENIVKATNVLLPDGALLEVTVQSNNEFNLVYGSGLTVSKIPYTVTRYDGSAVSASNNVVLQVSSGVTENSADLTFSTTEEDIGKATLSGAHKDNMAFFVEIKGVSSSEGTTEEPSEIYIGNKAQLLAFAKSVNDGNSYSGKTVKLTADIDLAGEEWTPIGPNADDSKKFKGTFDGQGHTISNLYVETDAGYTAAGFFGALNGVAKNFVIDGATIKHISTGGATDNGIAVVAGSLYTSGTIDGVTVKNAVVEGNRYTGGISGYTYGTVKNCKVIDSTITAVPNAVGQGYDNGDKVGGIAGYWSSESTYSMTGNTVEKVTLKAYRDVGGITGTAHCVTADNFKGNTVKDVLIIVDQKTNNYGNKDENAGEIVKRVTNGALGVNVNTFENVVISKVPTPNDEGAFEIATEADFRAFAWSVNNGNNYAGKTVKLTADIDLEGKEWTPIGSNDKPFKGTFDGQEHIISNLVVNGGSKSDQGLFGKTDSGEIKNLVVNNAKVSGYLDIGAVAGTPYTSKYTNIKLTGHVEVSGFAYVGGVGGKNAYADWTDITVEVDEGSFVKAYSINTAGNAYRTYVGGVIGFMGEGGHKFTNVNSNIDVIGSTCDVGGITGIAHYGNSFVNCVCTGDVIITDAEEANEAEQMGGIAGVWHNQNGCTVTFTTCQFSGTLTANIIEGVDLSDNIIYGAPYLSAGTGQVVVN